MPGSSEEKKKEATIDPSAAAKALGRRGGEARAKSLSKEERRKIASKGAKAMWRKHRKNKK